MQGRTLRRPHGRLKGLLLFAVLAMPMVSAPADAEDPTNMVIPVVGTIISSINQITCPTRGDISITCPGPIPLPDPCDRVDLPYLCKPLEPIVLDPCDYVPGAPALCQPIPQIPKPCDLLPGTPGICQPVVVEEPCYYVPGAPVICQPVVIEDPCYYLPGTPGLCEPVVIPEPCTLVPGLPGVCVPVTPPPPPPPPSAAEITSLQIAIAIGNIRPNVGVVPRPPDPVVNLLGFCQPYLNEFLGNTEYLGPLLDYGTCLNAGSVPAIMNTLPVVNNDVSFLAGACSLVTSAYQNNNVSFVDFSGIVDCTAGAGNANVFRPGISVQANLVDALRPSVIAYGSSGSGVGYARSNARHGNSISGSADGGTAKVRLSTTIHPGSAICTVDGVCGFNWVVLPNKSPDTGASISCNSTQLDNDVLVCTSNGIVMTDSTIAHK